jgi:hypothetical protein
MSLSIYASLFVAHSNTIPAYGPSNPEPSHKSLSCPSFAIANMSRSLYGRFAIPIYLFGTCGFPAIVLCEVVFKREGAMAEMRFNVASAHSKWYLDLLDAINMLCRKFRVCMIHHPARSHCPSPITQVPAWEAPCVARTKRKMHTVDRKKWILS